MKMETTENQVKTQESFKEKASKAIKNTWQGLKNHPITKEYSYLLLCMHCSVLIARQLLYTQR